MRQRLTMSFAGFFFAAKWYRYLLAMLIGGLSRHRWQVVSRWGLQTKFRHKPQMLFT
jgi:hypothetical protein